MRRHFELAGMSPLVVAVFLWIQAASAQEAPDVEPPGYREAVEAALSEYAAGHHEEASTLFARAHAIFPSARTLRGLGMAAFELRRYPESITQLEAALMSDIRPLEGTLREETEALVVRARAFVGSVQFSLSPPEATLSLDGEPVDPARSSVLVPLGDHVLEARAPGYGSEKKTLRIRGGERLQHAFRLVPPQVATRTETPEPARSRGKRAWLWTGIGVAVVGAAVTGVLLARRDDGETVLVPSETPNSVAGAVLTTRGER